VSIASYRDSECGPTLRDLFEKASLPQRYCVLHCMSYYCVQPQPEGRFELHERLVRSAIFIHSLLHLYNSTCTLYTAQGVRRCGLAG
jgi:hypothetical protein